MTTDVWKDYVSGAATVAPAEEVATDPWSTYTAPGLTTPRAQPELTAAPGDKYRAAAIRDVAATNKAGWQPGYTERLGKGAGLGWTDEIMAAGRTPIEMLRKGTINPAEGYRYAKAQQDVLDAQMRANTEGILGAGVEVLGGLTGGAGVFSGPQAAAARIPFTSRTVPAGVMNYGTNVAKAGGMGSVMGAGEAENIEGIPAGMLKGGVLGAGVGAVLPAAVAVGAPAIQHTARVLQAPRLRDPQNIAVEQIAEVARAAGVTPAEITRRVADANAAGQPYTVADALGHEGARKLAGLAKVPGPQREAIVQAMTERNLNMPVRTSEEIGQAMGAPQTARQAQEALHTRAQTEAAPHYERAEAYPTWSSRLQEQFLDHPLAQRGLREGVRIQSIENAGTGQPFRPHDAMITGFDEAGNTIWSGVPNLRSIDVLKKGLDRMIDDQTDAVTGRLTQEGRAIVGFKNRMLQEVDAINPAYGEARATFADPMQIRSAVERGKEMKRTGRAADNIEEFREMRPGEQAGARIGYADDVQKQLEQTGNFPALLREKSVKGARELEEFNVYQGPRRPGEPDPLRRYLNREEEMLKTSHKAIGGSSTAENLADVAAGPGGADVFGIAANAMTGNLPAAGWGLFNRLGTIAKGESEAQRVAITRALLARDTPTVEQLAQQLEQHELRRRGVNPWTGTHRLRPGE